MRYVGLDVEQGAVTSFMEASEDGLSDMRKDDLLSTLAKIGRRQTSSLRKQQLVIKIISIQQAVLAGTDTLQEPEVSDEEGCMARDSKSMEQEQLRASLSSWVLNPLVATSGMKEGSINETEFLKALPSFVVSTPCLEGGENNGVTSSLFVGDRVNTHLRVDYIKRLGLVCQRGNEMLSDSPDGLCGLLGASNETICAVIEIKTMTSPPTIEDAKQVSNCHRRIFHIAYIGTSSEDNSYFEEVVPSTAYRLQCLHHTVVFGVDHVLFVDAKGSSMGTGRILYAVLL